MLLISASRLTMLSKWLRHIVSVPCLQGHVCNKWVCLQGMGKWIGGPTDEWSFLRSLGFWGPLTKAKLAFYLDKGMLQPYTHIAHVSEVRRDTMGEPLSEFISALAGRKPGIFW